MKTITQLIAAIKLLLIESVYKKASLVVCLIISLQSNSASAQQDCPNWNSPPITEGGTTLIRSSLNACSPGTGGIGVLVFTVPGTINLFSLDGGPFVPVFQFYAFNDVAVGTHTVQMQVLLANGQLICAETRSFNVPAICPGGYHDNDGDGYGAGAFDCTMSSRTRLFQ